MKYPALILVVAFMSSFASADDSVPAIQISNLPAGQTLNVFYANGRPAAISQAGSTPIIRSVYQGPNRTNIPSSGIINLPATNVVNNSLFWVTDYVVLAVNSGTQKHRPNSPISPMFVIFTSRITTPVVRSHSTFPHLCNK
jgi:hypothetical protein